MDEEAGRKGKGGKIKEGENKRSKKGKGKEWMKKVRRIGKE